MDGGFIRVIGKADKRRLCRRQLRDQYIQSIFTNPRTCSTAAGNDDILFLNRRGAKLSRVMIFLMLKICTDSGHPKECFAAYLSSSFATHLLKEAPTSAPSRKLGHESITTTEI